MAYIKASVIFLFLIHLLGTDSHSQNLNAEPNSPSKITSDSTEIIIRKIRKEFNRINSDTSKMKVVKEDISGQTTEGGAITKFYESNILKKARLVFYGETGKSITEYYFLNGQLFFCFEQNDQYNKPMYERTSKVDKKEENRFYFHKQKLIRWITGKGKIADKSLYNAKEKEILDDIKDIH